MHVHSLHQYLIPTNIWYEVAHWWKVSRACCKGWWFYKYRNVSWRPTPDFSGCWLEIPILILNNNQLLLLDGKGIKQRPFACLNNLHANERSSVPAWKVIEANRCENSTILSQISAVVDLYPRVRANNSTNNHELNNTLIEPYQVIYLVEFYG